MGTKKNQKRKTARRAYEKKRNLQKNPRTFYDKRGTLKFLRTPEKVARALRLGWLEEK
jgi:hypothetical protein